MTGAVYFSVMLLTYYLAGMYRSLPLMTLAVAQLLLAVVLFALSRYFRGRLTVRFPTRSGATEVGMTTNFRVVIQSGGRLPVSRIGLRLCVGYRDSPESTEELFYSGERGKNELELQTRFPYCGLANVQLDEIRAFDYLSLFSSAKVLFEEMEIAVFPGDASLSITASDFGLNGNLLTREQTVNRPGDAFHEIRQIREYRTGDPNRRIHWNLSAKTDKLWIKEYQRETDPTVELYLDMTGAFYAAQEEYSAFYTLLSALVLGLLKEAAAVKVHWYKGKDHVTKSVCDAGECRELLLALYQTDFDEETLTVPSVKEGFQLTLSLSLWQGEQLIYQFSPDTLEREIKEKTFIL